MDVKVIVAVLAVSLALASAVPVMEPVLEDRALGGEKSSPVTARYNVDWKKIKGRRFVIDLDASDSKGPIDRYVWTLLSTSDKGRKIEAAHAVYTTTEPGLYEWKLSVCTVRNRCDVKFKNVRVKD